MKTTTRYVMRNIPHPWDAARMDGGVMAWCICRETIVESWPDRRPVDVVPVAIFNLDSEAENFQLMLHMGHGVALDKQTADYLNELEEIRARTRAKR